MITIEETIKTPKQWRHAVRYYLKNGFTFSVHRITKGFPFVIVATRSKPQ